MTAERVAPLTDVLQPFGLGWRAILCERTVQLTVRRIRHDGGALRGYVEVDYRQPGGKRAKLAGELLNLSSGRDRASFANRLAERQAGVEWRNVLDAFCVLVETREAAGPDLVWVGNLPEPIDGGWLIEGLIQRNQTTGIHGDGAVGKSFFVLATAVSLVTGLEVIPGLRPTARMNAIYCDYETDQDTLNQRVRMIAGGLGLERAPDIGYYRMEQPFADCVEWLLPVVQAHNVGLVIVDSVEAAMSGSVGAGAGANEGPARMNRSLRQLGVSALLVDHINNEQEGQRGAVKRPYGSRFKRNWQRMSFHLKQAREPGPDKIRHLGLCNVKWNNGEEGAVTGLAWEINSDWCRWWREDIEDEELAAALPSAEQIALYLRHHGPSQPSQIAEDTAIPRGTVSSTLTRRTDLFSKTPHGLWDLVRRQSGADLDDDM